MKKYDETLQTKENTNLIEGYGFILLTSSNYEKFLQTLKFFNNLNFSIIKVEKKLTEKSKEVNCENFLYQVIERVWILQSTKENENQDIVSELTGSSVLYTEKRNKNSNDVIIQICYNEDKYVMEKKVDIFFYVESIENMKIDLKKKKIDFQDNGDLIVLKDPENRTLKFTEKKNPLNFLDVSCTSLIEEKTHSKMLNNTIYNKRDSKIKIAFIISKNDYGGIGTIIRSIVRTGLYYNCDVYGVNDGFNGLMSEKELCKMKWSDVTHMLNLSTLFLLKTKCEEFKTYNGRLKAALKLINYEINGLIVCGGFGTLVGIDILKKEWPFLIKDLLNKGLISEKQYLDFFSLTVVGLSTSINNFFYNSDVNIGFYSSLSKIVELIDYLNSTARSHSRAFVVEIMGKNSGWLALMSGICTGSDYIFIPEKPEKVNTWKENLKNVVINFKSKGRRKTTIVISESAIDENHDPITSDQIKEILESLNIDTRISKFNNMTEITTSVAYDRMIGSLKAHEAVKTILKSKSSSIPWLIGLIENKVVKINLSDTIELQKKMLNAFKKKDYNASHKLRNKNFMDLYQHFESCFFRNRDIITTTIKKKMVIGIVHVGASSSGLNPATRAIVLYCLSNDHKIIGIQNGFNGMINNEKVKELSWTDVDHLYNKGGSVLGTNRVVINSNIEKVAKYLENLKLDGLIVIGGFEAFHSIHQINQNKEKYPIFNIPIVLIPATISNNVPGTEYSLGSDTCLNQLLNYCDTIKKTVSSSLRKIYIFEVHGGYCGYVASYCGLICGASVVYTFESDIHLQDLQNDIKLITKLFEIDKNNNNNDGIIVIRNEKASPIYTSKIISSLFKKNSTDFDTQVVVPGHAQQGLVPSPIDRLYSIKYGTKSVQFLEEWYNQNNQTNSDSSVVIGTQGENIKFTSIEYLTNFESNFEMRKSNIIHWDYIIEVNNILSGSAMFKESRMNEVF